MLFLLFQLVSVLPAQSQDITGVYTLWSDSFRQWVVRTDSDWREGSIEMRWRLNDDWTVWDFRLGDTLAEIRLDWKEDPNVWRITCLNETVIARTMWRDNFLEWRLDDGNHNFVWKSRYGNVFDEWVLRQNDQGEFAIYTYWEGDPREWVIYDQLKPEVSYAMRVAMIFLAIYHSTPKI